LSDHTDDFKKGVHWLTEHTKVRRQYREKIHQAHIDYIKGGKSYNESMDLCLERFAFDYKAQTNTPLTDRVFANIVGRPLGAVGDSLTEATIIVQINRMMGDSQELRDEVDRQLEALDDKADHEWIEVELEEMSGGKFEGSKVKKIPVYTRRLQLQDKKLAINDKFFDSIKALLPKQNLNIFVKGGDVMMLDDADLTAQLNKFEKTHKPIDVEHEEVK
jgi:hypothetical protein